MAPPILGLTALANQFKFLMATAQRAQGQKPIILVESKIGSTASQIEHKPQPNCAKNFLIAAFGTLVISSLVATLLVGRAGLSWDTIEAKGPFNAQVFLSRH